jgi:hypothetical protein
VKLLCLCLCLCLGLGLAAAAPPGLRGRARAPRLAPLHPSVLAGRLARAPAAGGYVALHARLAPHEAAALAGYTVPAEAARTSSAASTVYVPARPATGR